MRYWITESLAYQRKSVEPGLGVMVLTCNDTYGGRSHQEMTTHTCVWCRAAGGGAAGSGVGDGCLCD